MTTTYATDPTPGTPVYCLDCGQPLSRPDSRRRRRGSICEGKHERKVLLETTAEPTDDTGQDGHGHA